MSEPSREPIPLREPILVKRYSVAARVHHWFTAVTAILLALSGLAFFHPSLFFLTHLFGGPTWTRIIHPWLGVSFLDLFVRFWRDNIWHPDDWVWIKNLSLVGHHEEKLPELRRYNAGQKAMFWIMTITIFAIFLSGIVLWQSQFGGAFSTGQMRIAAIVHAASAVLMVINLIVHVYAAIWFRGTIRAMTRGTVTGGWAWKHHRQWLRATARRGDEGAGAIARAGAMKSADTLTSPIPIGTEATPPFVRLPELDTVFARRAERCRQLAEGHPLQPYLLFVAALASAQDHVVESLPGALLPGPDDLAEARTAEAPLVGLRRGGTWILALRTMLERLRSFDMPGAARRAVTGLDGCGWMDLLERGQRVLDSVCDEREAAAGCFVMAALQVACTRAAATMRAGDVEPREDSGLCPMCGSRPVVSVVHAVGNLHGARFLHCALCSTQWHFVRIKCANCASTEGIAYQRIQGGDDAVKAETCDACRTYTKILYLERDPRLEPFADDLASYALDVLVTEAGWRRAAPNPFLMPIPQ